MNIFGFMKIKTLKKAIQYLAIGLAGIICIGCGKKGDMTTLVMGCSADYPPFEFQKNGEIIGSDVDLAKAICEKLGYELEIKDMEFSGLIAGLNSGGIDFAMSGMAVTEERVKRVDFSQQYYEPKFAMLYRKDTMVDDVKKMKGRKIGVQLGTTMEAFVKEKANKMSNIEIKSLSRNPELIQELKIGRIDAIVIEESQVVHFAKANNDLTYSTLEDAAGEGYAIAFPKGSELKAKFDGALDEMKANGELKEILNKWAL